MPTASRLATPTIPNGQITQEFFSDGTSYTYTYDSQGKLLTATDPTTGTVQFKYNSADELTEVDYPDNEYLRFQYDSGGRRTQMVDQTGFTTNYHYDAAGRPSPRSPTAAAIRSLFTRTTPPDG